jgi:hypothetical protein
MSEQEVSETIRELRARLCEDDACLTCLTRIVRGACPHRGLGICEKTGELCLDGSKWKQCKVYLENSGDEDVGFYSCYGEEVNQHHSEEKRGDEK